MMKSLINQTRKHYEQVPFEQDLLREANFKNTLTFYAFENYEFRNKKICDIGCSTSFIGSYIQKKFPKYKYLGIDINPQAVKTCNSKGLNSVVGNNLNLCLFNESSDFTISEGVIHHTPNPFKCFDELIRITKRKGLISLMVYNKKNYYYYLYKASWIIRKLYEKNNKIANFLVKKIVFPFYKTFYFSLGAKVLLKIKQKIPVETIYSNFHDQILTPVAHFFTGEGIIDFAENNGLRLLKTKKMVNGQGLLFLFRKVK